MKKLILIALLSALSSSLFAQNWFPVNRTGVNYYEGSRKIFSGYVTDSSVQNGDITFLTQKNLQSTYSTGQCRLNSNHSWFGKSIKVVQDTCIIFYNYENYPVVLYTNTLAGTSWIAYTKKNRRYIITHEKTELMNWFDKLDSVKVFTITSTDTTGKALSTNYKSGAIKLSKTFGLIKTVSFFNFPQEQFGLLSFPDTAELKGAKDIQTGVKNLTLDSVFAINIGDEFHEIAYKNNYNGSVYSADTSLIILKVLDKKTTGDSMVFVCSRRMQTAMFRNMITTFVTTIDTIKKGYSRVFYDFLNHEPGITENIDNNIQILFMTNDNNLFCKKSFVPVVLTRINDTCLNATDEYAPLFTFIKGAGPYYESYMRPWTVSSSYGSRLVYYKKGSQIWGTPWPENVGTKEASLKNLNISVFPNPVKNGLTLVNGNYNPLLFKLYSIKGELLIEQTIETGETMLNTEHLPVGLYFYSILGQGTIVNQKLVKE
ncbi:MAG: T9SS type A sorting domain-containing protein [Bacteroidota bacterium]